MTGPRPSVLSRTSSWPPSAAIRACATPSTADPSAATITTTQVLRRVRIFRTSDFRRPLMTGLLDSRG